MRRVQLNTNFGTVLAVSIGTVGRVPGRPVPPGGYGDFARILPQSRDEERSSRDQRDESVTFSPLGSLIITGPGCPPGVFLLAGRRCV